MIVNLPHFQKLVTNHLLILLAFPLVPNGCGWRSWSFFRRPFRLW